MNDAFQTTDAESEALWIRTDQWLLRASAKGDSTAWTCLIQRYERLVYHFPIDAGLATHLCDVVFEATFQTLLDQLDGFAGIDDLSSWIGRTAQQHTWRVLRQAEPARGEWPAAYRTDDAESLPWSDVSLKVQQAKIRRALNRLDKTSRALVQPLLLDHKTSRVDAADVHDIVRVAENRRAIFAIRSVLRTAGILDHHLATTG